MMKTSLAKLYGTIYTVSPSEPLRRIFDDKILDESIWDKEFDIQEFTESDIVKLKSFSGYNIIKRFNSSASSHNFDTVHYIMDNYSLMNPVILLDGYTVLDGYHRTVAACAVKMPLAFIRLLD